MNFTFDKLLILTPHFDDAEIGAGATLARFCREGKNIYHASFSMCEESLPKDLPKDISSKEIIKAGGKLGIPSSNIKIFNYPVRFFPKNRQQILEDIIQLKTQINPDLVLIPCSSDIHQDHKVIYEEGVRAFKNTTILGYEMPWNNLEINNRCFIKVTAEDLNKKVNAIMEYKSQHFRGYINEEYIKSLSIVRGTQVSSNLAETFEVIRLVF